MNKQELVTGLRFCGSRDFCDDCPIYDECHEPDFDICLKAADVIETHMWISVKERLPETEGKYIVCTAKGSVYCAKFSTRHGPCFHTDMYTHITHWMPLPEPPEEVEE